MSLLWPDAHQDQVATVEDLVGRISGLERQLVPGTHIGDSVPTSAQQLSAINARYPLDQQFQTGMTIHWFDPSSNVIRNAYYQLNQLKDTPSPVQADARPANSVVQGSRLTLEDGTGTGNYNPATDGENYAEHALLLMARATSGNVNQDYRYNNLATAIYDNGQHYIAIDQWVATVTDNQTQMNVRPFVGGDGVSTPAHLGLYWFITGFFLSAVTQGKLYSTRLSWANGDLTVTNHLVNTNGAMNFPTTTPIASHSFILNALAAGTGIHVIAVTPLTIDGS